MFQVFSEFMLVPFVSLRGLPSSNCGDKLRPRGKRVWFIRVSSHIITELEKNRNQY